MKRIYHLIRFPAFTFYHECYDKRINCLHIPLAQEMNITMSSDILAARVNMNQNEYRSIVFSCFSLKTNYLIKCLNCLQTPS